MDDDTLRAILDAQAMAQQKTLDTLMDKMEKTFNTMATTPAGTHGATLDDAAKARLIVSKLDAAAFARFTNHILPKKPAEVSVQDTVKTLQELFGHNTSVFVRRYTYLRTQCSGETLRDYTGLVNRRHVMAEFNTITAEQMKCLVWICGLSTSDYADIRAHALRKMEENPHLTLKELSTDCDYLEKTCHFCKRIGHKKGFCRNFNRGRKRNTKEKPRHANKVVVVASTATSAAPVKRIYRTVTINGTPTRMRLDTGADVTLLSLKDWTTIGRHKLLPPLFALRSADNKEIKKKNGSIRLCADFSTGLNDALDQHQHPLPTPDDIFTKMNGGQYFSQLDLAEAYLQLEVDEESRPLLTINTHQGLYGLNRLPFGVKSAPAIFQQQMDTMVAGLDGTAAYLDDIIVTGKTINEHNARLEAVLRRIHDYGFRLRLEKCSSCN
ncbi:reverse transcriptase [Teladorsagia circumcincta]|uniref:Reverse transcriptase n=1 Tax=Teladorsagia circumcincta TaxID=45464 RepID=A0A2G9U0N4_TELCI|nr:reverse transcriptase [Teladorsagia circumcincta]